MMGMMGESPPPWSAAAGELLAAALQRYLPSNFDSDEVDSADFAIDAYSCDEFRMYEFKVRRCARGRAHDWTECPYAHPGEKARRRDPRRHHYSGAACPDFRKGICKRGDGCEFAHGVFECWLHPARYRTQPCKDGTACRRRVCFFAHTPDQLRLLPLQLQGLSPKAPELYDGSPLRRLEAMSPPVSPTATLSPTAVSDLAASMRKLQLGKVARVSGGMFGARVCGMGGWKGEEETEVRVESGRALRARMFERLSMEGGLGSPPPPPPPPPPAAAPDVGWVSDLVN